MCIPLSTYWGFFQSLPLLFQYLIYNAPVHSYVFFCYYTVAGGDAGVLSQCQSGAGRLQVGHEDGPQRHERALQTQTHSCHPRTGEECRENATHLLNLFVFFSMKAQPVSVSINTVKRSLKLTGVPASIAQQQ